MERVFRLGEKMHALKLIASFLIVMSLLGVLVSVAKILQTWTVLDRFEVCKNDVGLENTFFCKELLYKETGLLLYPGQAFFNSNQLVIIAFKPIIPLFWWLAVFVFAVMLYRFGHHILPINSKKVKNKK